MTKVNVTQMIGWQICFAQRAHFPFVFGFALRSSECAIRLTTNYCLSVQIEVGLVVGNSQVAFEKAENSSLNLIGKIQFIEDSE